MPRLHPVPPAVDDALLGRFLDGAGLWRDMTPTTLQREPAEPLPVYAHLDRLAEAVVHAREFTQGARVDARVEQGVAAWRQQWTDSDGIALYTKEAEAQKREKLTSQLQAAEGLAFRVLDLVAGEAAGALHRLARQASELPTHTASLPPGATTADRLAAQQLDLAEDEQARKYQRELSAEDVLAYYTLHVARGSGNRCFLRAIEAGWMPPLDGSVDDTARAFALQRAVRAARAARMPGYVREHIGRFQQLLAEAGAATLWVDVEAAGGLRRPH